MQPLTKALETDPQFALKSNKPPAPLWLKLSFTAFVAVLVPVYLANYGPTNFLYFCDVALILTLVGIWTNKSLFISMGAVGILLPQFLWVVDFVGQMVEFPITGMTSYMFDPQLSLFARGLSLFHGWLPFLLLFLVMRMGYDKRALLIWTATAWTLMLISYFFLPRPGTALANPKAPVNIDYVFGLSDRVAQTWMPEWAWLTFLLVAMPLVIFIPTHFALKKFCKPATN